MENSSKTQTCRYIHRHADTHVHVHMHMYTQAHTHIQTDRHTLYRIAENVGRRNKSSIEHISHTQNHIL